MLRHSRFAPNHEVSQGCLLDVLRIQCLNLKGLNSMIAHPSDRHPWPSAAFLAYTNRAYLLPLV